MKQRQKENTNGNMGALKQNRCNGERERWRMREWRKKYNNLYSISWRSKLHCTIFLLLWLLKWFCCFCVCVFVCCRVQCTVFFVCNKKMVRCIYMRIIIFWGCLCICECKIYNFFMIALNHVQFFLLSISTQNGTLHCFIFSEYVWVCVDALKKLYFLVLFICNVYKTNEIVRLCITE